MRFLFNLIRRPIPVQDNCYSLKKHARQILFTDKAPPTTETEGSNLREKKALLYTLVWEWYTSLSNQCLMKESAVKSEVSRFYILVTVVSSIVAQHHALLPHSRVCLQHVLHQSLTRTSQLVSSLLVSVTSFKKSQHARELISAWKRRHTDATAKTWVA